MAAFKDDFLALFGGSVSLCRIVKINILVSISLWLAAVTANFFDIHSDRIYEWFSLPSDAGSFLRHPWTILTYMFVQYDPIHLIFNIIWLLCFGRVLLHRVNDRDIMKMYISGGLSGGAAYMLLNYTYIIRDTSSSYICGASAAVIAMMTCAALLLPDLKLRLLFLGEIKLKWLAAVCVVLIFIGPGYLNTSETVAHAGGVACGLIIALSYKRGFPFSNPVLSFSGLKIKSRHGDTRYKNGMAVAEAIKNCMENDRRQLDSILDKMKYSGFSSLSKEERDELLLISKRLKDTDNVK